MGLTSPPAQDSATLAGGRPTDRGPAREGSLDDRREASDPLPTSRALAAERRTWWVTFLAFTCLISLWALASPPFSIPDEPSHTIRAVSASRGQILPGERRGDYFTEVDIPAIFANVVWVPMCFASEPDVPAGCAPALTGSDETVTTITSAGTYPPAYYTVVGLPSLGFRSPSGVYLMRILSAAICGALLASAFVSVWSTRPSRLAAVGTAFAVTPMVPFLAGSVNPNGVEVAAAIALWASLAVAVTRTPSDRSTRLLVRVAVAGLVLALSRPASPLWVALIVLMVALWAGHHRVLDFVRDRRTWPVAFAVGAGCIFTTAWVAGFGTLEETPGRVGPFGGSYFDNVRSALGMTPGQIDQMLAVFGWLDTPVRLSIYLWLLAVGALVLWALISSTWHQAAASLATIAGAVLLPVFLQAPRAATQGFPWQGRYTLPLAVGLPILAGLQIDRARLLPDHMARRLSVVLLSMFVVGQVSAHVWATRRYTSGMDGRLNWLAADGWHPPLPAWALFTGFVAVVPLIATWVHTRGAGEPDRLEPPGTLLGAPAEPAVPPRPRVDVGS